METFWKRSQILMNWNWIFNTNFGILIHSYIIDKYCKGHDNFLKILHAAKGNGTRGHLNSQMLLDDFKVSHRKVLIFTEWNLCSRGISFGISWMHAFIAYTPILIGAQQFEPFVTCWSICGFFEWFWKKR